MSREIRYDPEGHSHAPRYIDHGHVLRKAAFWSVVALLMPVALLGAAAELFVELLEPVARRVSRLNTWAHPCLYRLPGVSETHDEYMKRSRTFTTGKEAE